MMISPQKNELTIEFNHLNKERRQALLARMDEIEERIDYKKEVRQTEIDLLNADIQSFNNDLVNYGGQKGFGIRKIKVK